MVNKLLILGMDGLDYDVIRKYSKDLPNLEELQKKDGYPRMRSIFPADTTPAWSTIYLGVDPSHHGIINFVNLADKENSYKPNVFDDSAFKGKTFWDKMSEDGLKCGVILPMNIKEGWEIPNGIMITRPNGKKGHVIPESKEKLYKPNYHLLSTESKFTSERGLRKLEKLFLDKADEEARLTLEVIKNEELDVVFSYFSTPDGVQHDFWSHCDETHRDYKENNKYKLTIFNVYKKMDDLIGIIRELDPSLKILIISDHGHGARPCKTIRINEILRRNGYLQPKNNKTGKKKKRSFKSKVFKLIRKIGMPKFMVKLAKKFPIWKKLMAPSDIIDWDNTKAYLSDLSAVKNYSYGGIKINSNITQNKDELCDEIISKLKVINQDDKPLFLWIDRINNFYHGPYLYKYPEIVFQMNEEYGAGWDLGEQLVLDEPTFNMISPGGHRYYTATICACNFTLNKKEWDLVEMRSLIEQIVYKEQ